MKQIGTPAVGGKHVQAVTNRYGLRIRRKDVKRSPDNRVLYQWPIEGESLTFKEISERIGWISNGLLRSRLGEMGWRTWEKLGAPVTPQKAATPARKAAHAKNMRRIRLIYQAAKEKREYMQRLNAAHAKL